jgi:hypothetical protein
MKPSFRLCDFTTLAFLGPVESRKDAEKRKTRATRGKRDATNNWYRLRVHPVRVEADGRTIEESWRRTIEDWRKGLF